MAERILIGTAWPYANGPLHLGHIAGCYLPADTFARYQRLMGNEVLMVSGSDAHGTPITVRADQEGVEPAVIAERYHQSFLDSWKRLGISFDLFTSTHTANHEAVTQDFFLRMREQGYIYTQVMQAPYCPNEKRFLPDRYVEGTCPHCSSGARGDQCDHCGRTLSPTELLQAHCKFCGATPETRDTEHFFFKLSAFEDRLREWVSDKTYWKHNVMNFTKAFLEEGLRDGPITRDMTWGVPIPVPGYETKRIYVWFEAVIGYLSATKEWAQDKGKPDDWKRFWMEPCRIYNFIGKDNIVFHTLRWPAYLLAVGGLNMPYDVPANEFLTLSGRQLSTSRNWAVWVPDYLERYDPDALRYVLSINSPETNDADFSWEEFLKRNNNELVAAYGNLVNRCVTFVQKHFDGVPPATRTEADEALLHRAREAVPRIGDLIGLCRFKEGMREIMALTREGNVYFDAQEPWKTVKTDKARAGTALNTTLNFINVLKVLFYPYLPFSSEKLHRMLGYSDSVEQHGWKAEELPAGHKLGTPEPLFKKLEPTIVDEENARLG
ncbi:MAG TPA: methionine--tRNA ligase [Candidatus Xenobia bacterium]|jgi:methionyl-tRNA synthetase